eukprot:CAMPEP_0178752998 /NCGR_PEP_ID=MMETSP0744-20121128/11374_1 /TAXON_ID=913974 /ORGANISM="Nitzschia punctata, Strain CCMP561" /LENGTH=239 /DNA_ID=CAMNT_0020406779 /DNA_START=93 /DNA_END=813 /DNA_ORIENTATION=+
MAVKKKNGSVHMEMLNDANIHYVDRRDSSPASAQMYNTGWVSGGMFGPRRSSPDTMLRNTTTDFAYSLRDGSFRAYEEPVVFERDKSLIDLYNDDDDPVDSRDNDTIPSYIDAGQTAIAIAETGEKFGDEHQLDGTETYESDQDDDDGARNWKIRLPKKLPRVALAPYGQEYVAKAIEVTVLIEAERAVEDAAHLRQMVQGNAPEVLVEGARVQPLDATISADTVPAVENYPRPDRKDM